LETERKKPCGNERHRVNLRESHNGTLSVDPTPSYTPA
jgi:hypothetical protein